MITVAFSLSKDEAQLLLELVRYEKYEVQGGHSKGSVEALEDLQDRLEKFID